MNYWERSWVLLTTVMKLPIHLRGHIKVRCLTYNTIYLGINGIDYSDYLHAGEWYSNATDVREGRRFLYKRIILTTISTTISTSKEKELIRMGDKEKISELKKDIAELQIKKEDLKIDKDGAKDKIADLKEDLKREDPLRKAEIRLKIAGLKIEVAEYDLKIARIDEEIAKMKLEIEKLKR